MTAHYVYRLSDKADRLLYIGSTQSVADRVEIFHKNPRTSRRSFAMFGLIDHYTSVEYESKDLALTAEREAIRNEDPFFNDQSTGRAAKTRAEYDALYAEPQTEEDLRLVAAINEVLDGIASKGQVA